MTYSLGSQSSPAATVERKSDYVVKVTVAAGATPVSSYTFFIDKILNPYSRVQSNNVVVKHYAGCGSQSTACKADQQCTSPLLLAYDYPSYETGQLGGVEIESWISPSASKNDANYTGSTDGNFHI
jgi:hypothetical protein